MARPAASPEQRAEQRGLIRRAAAEIHAEKGIAGISARAVAVRAGVSTGTIYRYFGSLQELMRSFWTEPVAKANETLEAAARAHPDPLTRIEALLTTYADFAHTNPEVYRGAFLFVRPESLGSPDAEPLDALPFHRLLCDAIREAQIAGQVRREDADEMAQLLWAGLHGALSLPIHIDLYAVAPSETLAPAMIRGLIRSITA